MIDYFSLVPSGIVCEQIYSAPTFLQFSEESDVCLLVFCVGKLEDERFGASSAKDIGFVVLIDLLC